jgi:hypothetical protein
MVEPYKNYKKQNKLIQEFKFEKPEAELMPLKTERENDTPLEEQAKQVQPTIISVYKPKVRAGGSNVMTIHDINDNDEIKAQQEKIQFEPFQGEGNQLSDIHLKLTQEQLRKHRQEIFQQPEKKEIQPPPEKKEIQDIVVNNNDLENYKQLTKEYAEAEKEFKQAQKEQKTELEKKNEYEKYIDSIYNDKEKLKEEAELKGIDVKGKSIKQVRDILLGKQEDFKLEPLPEEKQIANIQEEEDQLKILQQDKRAQLMTLKNDVLRDRLDKKNIPKYFINEKGQPQKKNKNMMVEDLMKLK